jgi:hypothetical protein
MLQQNQTGEYLGVNDGKVESKFGCKKNMFTTVKNILRKFRRARNGLLTNSE